MKALITRLAIGLVRMVRRFQAGQPRGAIEGIVFGAVRNIVAVVFFPPPMEVRNVPAW